MATLPVHVEAQIAPADARAKLIKKALLPMLWQLISPGVIKAFGPTASKHGYERAFTLYVSTLFIIYVLNVFLEICLITIIDSDMEESAWARKAMKPALFAALATSFAAVLLGTVLSLLP